MQLKTLFFTLLLSSLHCFSRAQIAGSRQQKNAYLADYVGTWMGRTPTGEFKLLLEERTIHWKPDGRDYNIITGRHSYTTSSGTSNESLSKSSDKYVFSGMSDYKNPEQIFATFTDEVNHKSVQVKLSFIDSSKTKLSWMIIRENEAWTFDATKPVLPGVSVPSNVVLTKVK